MLEVTVLYLLVAVLIYIYMSSSYFSTRDENNGLECIKKICESLRDKHISHMDVYHSDNDKRMTGNHETSSYDQFEWG